MSGMRFTMSAVTVVRMPKGTPASCRARMLLSMAANDPPPPAMGRLASWKAGRPSKEKFTESKFSATNASCSSVSTPFVAVLNTTGIPTRSDASRP